MSYQLALWSNKLQAAIKKLFHPRNTITDLIEISGLVEMSHVVECHESSHGKAKSCLMEIKISTVNCGTLQDLLGGIEDSYTPVHLYNILEFTRFLGFRTWGH